jgi:hypothetical protein
LIKKKNVDIESLKKQLKLPATKDSQTKEVVETESQKEEILKLIMEQNAQIREMEAKMDMLIKEKEKNAQLSIVPLDVVPLIKIITTKVSTSTSTQTQTSNASDKLVKAMENMSIQGVEIERWSQEHVKSLQEQKTRIETSHQAEVQKS